MLLCHSQKQKEKGTLNRDSPGNSTICAYDGSKETVVDEQKVKSSQVFRKQKVLSIRRQLREGEYDLDRGLDAVMDMVLKELRE